MQNGMMEFFHQNHTQQLLFVKGHLTPKPRILFLKLSKFWLAENVKFQLFPFPNWISTTRNNLLSSIEVSIDSCPFLKKNPLNKSQILNTALKPPLARQEKVAISFNCLSKFRKRNFQNQSLDYIYHCAYRLISIYTRAVKNKMLDLRFNSLKCPKTPIVATFRNFNPNFFQSETYEVTSSIKISENIFHVVERIQFLIQLSLNIIIW